MKAIIQNGIITDLYLDAEAPNAAVGVPWYVRIGDVPPINDGEPWTRAGQPLVDPGYPIPVGDLFRELTDQELQSICALILTGPEQSRVPTFTFLCRAMAQTELSSIDPRVIAARSAFGPLLGDDRIAHLFRQR